VSPGDLRAELERRVALAEEAIAGLRELLAGIEEPAGNGKGSPAEPARESWLTAEQVAQRLGTSVRWVYDHQQELGGRQLSRRCLRFNETTVRRHLERRR
jgi:predicted DNA-binding transcriptional regulator AlpA